MARKRIGELLVERGLLNAQQLDEGLAHHRASRVRLGVALIQKGFITEDQLAQALGEGLAIPVVELKTVQPEWTAIHMLRARFCEQHDLFPYALEAAPGRKHLLVAMSDPLNVPALEEIEFTTGLKVSPRIATLSSVRAAIQRYYHKVNPEQANADGSMTIIHSKAGGGTVNLPADDRPTGPGAIREVEDVIEGELLEATEPAKPGDVLDDLFAAASPGSPAAKAAPKKRSPVDELSKDLDYLFGGREDPDPVEELERKFWTLLKLMAKKGLLTGEEFAKALRESGDEE